MKRLLITTGIFPPDIGGPASYAVTLGKNLPKNMKLTILCYSSVIKYKMDSEMPFKVIRVWHGWIKPLKHIIYFLKVFSQAGDHDVILALNAVSAGFPALLASRLQKKRFLVKIVGDYAWEMAIQKGKSSYLINDFQKSVKKGWIRILANIQVWVCQKADGIIVPSKYLAEIVVGWGVSVHKIYIIYNGVDIKDPNIIKEEARKKIGIPGNIIFSSGRLVSWKGFRMLVKIMPKLLEINQFFRLVIVGDGPEKKLLELMVKNLNLDRKVYLVGKKSKDELAEYLAASDMFVLNSGYEGFSHQILEAMVAGVPVIASAVGGNQEIIKQGENGFLVRYNDEFNLIQAIKGIHTTPELSHQFIEEGRKTIMKFSVEKMVKETVRVLNKF